MPLDRLVFLLSVSCRRNGQYLKPILHTHTSMVDDTCSRSTQCMFACPRTRLVRTPSLPVPRWYYNWTYPQSAIDDVLSYIVVFASTVPPSATNHRSRGGDLSRKVIAPTGSHTTRLGNTCALCKNGVPPSAYTRTRTNNVHTHASCILPLHAVHARVRPTKKKWQVNPVTNDDGSHRVPQTELPVSRRRAAGRGQSLSVPAPEAPRRLHRLAALVSLPLRHYRARPRVDYSYFTVSAGGGYQAPVAAKASAVPVVIYFAETCWREGGQDGR